MNIPKLVTVLCIVCILSLLGLLSAERLERPLVGDVPLRKGLVIALMATWALGARHWRTRTGGAVSSANASPAGGGQDFHRLKPLFLALAALTAVGYFLIPGARWPVCSLLIAASLLAAFFTRERDEDERVEHLKLRALRTGFISSFLALFGHAWLVGINAWIPATISAFDIISLTLLVALGLYHFWRWQDARPTRDDQPSQIP